MGRTETNLWEIVSAFIQSFVRESGKVKRRSPAPLGLHFQKRVRSKSGQETKCKDELESTLTQTLHADHVDQTVPLPCPLVVTTQLSQDLQTHSQWPSCAWPSRSCLVFVAFAAFDEEEIPSGAEVSGPKENDWHLFFTVDAKWKCTG